MYRSISAFDYSFCWIFNIALKQKQFSFSSFLKMSVLLLDVGLSYSSKAT